MRVLASVGGSPNLGAGRGWFIIIPLINAITEYLVYRD